MMFRPNARALRVNATEAEKALWREVRGRQLGGHKIRRQYPVGPYLADFCCFERRLVIELDGGQHAENRKDEERDRWLTERGWRVLRFWNNDVLTNIEGVKDTIIAALERQTSP